MSFLVQLPKYVALPLYVEWIEATDLCRLESSFCNKIDINLFLNTIQYEKVNFSYFVEFITHKVYLNFASWLIKRCVTIKQMTISLNAFRKLNPDWIVLFKSLEVLKIVDDIETNRNAFTQLIVHCANLIELTLNKSEVLNDRVMTVIASSCPKLLRFYCENKKDKNNPKVNVKGFLSIATTLKQLKEIQFNHFANFYDTAAIAFVENCKDLEVISISTSNITNATTIAIGKHCQKLTKLELIDCFEVDTIHNIAKNCKQLTTLIIKHQKQRPRHDIKFFLWKELMENHPMTQLTSLHLHGHERISDESVYEIVITLINLKSLGISGCTQELSAVGLKYVPAHLPDLTELDLSSNPRIDASVLTEIKKKCTKLRKVAIGNLMCESFSFESILSFLRGYNSLEVVSLRGIATAGFNSSKITIEQVNKLVEVNPNIISMDLSRNACELLRDENDGYSYFPLEKAFNFEKMTLKTLVFEEEKPYLYTSLKPSRPHSVINEATIEVLKEHLTLVYTLY